MAPLLTVPARPGCHLILTWALVFPAENAVCLPLLLSPVGAGAGGVPRRGKGGLDPASSHQDSWAQSAFSWVLCTRFQSGSFQGGSCAADAEGGPFGGGLVQNLERSEDWAILMDCSYRRMGVLGGSLSELDSDY